MMRHLGEHIPFDHMPKLPGVYRLTNHKTGESYIGSSRNMHKRAKTHSAGLRLCRHPISKLSASYFEHGAAAFSFEVLELVEGRKPMFAESRWITRTNPAFNRQGKGPRAVPIVCASIPLSSSDRKRFDRFRETFRLTGKAAMRLLMDVMDGTPRERLAEILIRESEVAA